VQRAIEYKLELGTKFAFRKIDYTQSRTNPAMKVFSHFSPTANTDTIALYPAPVRIEQKTEVRGQTSRSSVFFGSPRCNGGSFILFPLQTFPAVRLFNFFFEKENIKTFLQQKFFRSRFWIFPEREYLCMKSFITRFRLIN
jgi:hypothetical protein